LIRNPRTEDTAPLSPSEPTWLERDMAELMREQTARISPDDGLARFMAEVAANPKHELPALTTTPLASGWWQQLNIWLGGLGLSPAVASIALVVQGALIAGLLLQQPQGVDPKAAEHYRGGPVQADAVPDLKLTIHPDADFASLSTLLRSHGCRIVAGPSETGEIWVKVEGNLADNIEGKKRLADIRAALAQSRLVDDVAVKQ